MTPSTPCPTPEDLFAWSAGNLPPEQLRQVQAHLAGCPSCRSRLAPPGSGTLRPPPASPPQGSAPHEPPTRLREYELLEKIGEGGMGAVYRARHTRLDKIVALKVLPPHSMNDRAAVVRFEREMKAVGKLDHQNIVRATDAGEVDGVHFLVMEYVEGANLSQLIETWGQLPIADACELVRQAAVGLAHAHANGLIHRDVKPSNLLLTPAGTVKVLDLGLALLQGNPTATLDRTEQGVVLGTFDYIAPEQGADAHRVDGRADLYSLGCTLYALLVGHPPFGRGTHRSPFEKILAHAQAPVPPVRMKRPEIPERLAAVLDRLLAKNPDNRFAHAAEAVEALTPFAAGCDLPGLLAGVKPSGVRPAATLPATVGAGSPATRRRRWRVAVAAAILLVVAAAVAVAVLNPRAAGGVLEIETVDDAVTVIVEKDGAEVAVIDPKTSKHLPLASGKYRLRPGPGGDALELDPPDVTLEPNGKAIARIRRKVERPLVFAPPLPAPPGEVRRFEGHTEQVNAVAVTRDGKTAVSGSNDGTLRVWDVTTGRELRRCKGFEEIVAAVAVSPDGKYVLAGGGGKFDDEGNLAAPKDCALHLCELAGGEEVRRFQGHTKDVWGVAFSPDGRRALSAGGDGTARLWNVATGRELRRFRAQGAIVTSVAFSPDGLRFLTGSYDNTVRLWDAESGKVLRTYANPGHTAPVLTVAFAPDGRRFLSGGLDKTLRLWEVDSGKEVGRFPRQPTAVLHVCFSADGRRALSCSGSKREGEESYVPAGFDYLVRLWDVASGHELHRGEGHTSSVMHAAFTPDGYHALSACSDTTVRLWRLPDPLRAAPFAAAEAREMQRRWAAASRTPATLTNTVGMKLSLVPPGELAMSSRYRAVLTRPFYVGAHEVTVGQFRRFVAETDYKTHAESSGKGGTVQGDGEKGQKPEYTWRHPDVARGDDYPVGQLCWNDAARFCEWLSHKEKKTYRLPTEAEWEWACRAGALGDIHPLNDYAWNKDNSGGKTHPVGRLKANAWGLYDMLGNVAEFCGDWRAEYPTSAVADPRGPARERFRVIRGGAFVRRAGAAERFAASPNLSMIQFGFRVVCELPRATPADEFAPRVVSLIDATTQGYREWLERLKQTGYRPTSISTLAGGGRSHHTAIAVKDGKDFPWEATVRLNQAESQKAFDDLIARGYSAVSVGGCREGKEWRYDELYVQDGRKDRRAWLVASPEACVEKLKELARDGLRPFEVKGFDAGKERQYGILAERDDGTPYLVRIDMPDIEFKAFLAENRRRGYRPVSVSGYAGQGQPLFAAVLIRDRPRRQWVEMHGLLLPGCLQQNDRWTANGFRPLLLTGYRGGKGVRYLGVWIKDGLAEVPLPRTGQFVPRLAAFDRAMQQFMREGDIGVGTLAVMRGGKLVLTRGYGHGDRERKRTVPPDAPLRLASLSKPITAAAIRKLIREGKLRLDTRVAVLLGLQPPPGKKMDPRWQAVTVAHLLDHKGGWDSEAASDPMFRSLEIAKALGKPGPATAADVVRYMAGEPLQFAPGSKSVYSNFGYCLLGRAIEKVSGQDYAEYVQKEILAPLGIKSAALGRTLPAHRDPREPFYFDPTKGRNAMKPDSKDEVAAPDGTFCLEALDAHGGLIASAADYARFVKAYHFDGRPVEKDGEAEEFFGALPGTFTAAVRRPDGTILVALFNRWNDPAEFDSYRIAELLKRADDETRGAGEGKQP